jgi:hypothetical protein
MDPLSLTVSITALIGTTLKVLSYLNDAKHVKNERAELESETANLLPLLFNLKSRSEEAEDARDK